MLLTHRCNPLIAGICLLLCSGLAHARDYLIEVVIFETTAGQNLNAGGLYFPRIENSIRLGSEAAVAQGFLPMETGLTLAEDAAAIAAARRYRMLRHIAWRQPGLDAANARNVRIALGQTIPLYLPDELGDYPEFFPATTSPAPAQSKEINSFVVNGTIKIRLGRFLHMDTRLVFTDQNSGQSFRLSQSRKMRSGELHYIDNPRFGLLTRITPLEDKILPDTEEESTNDALAAPE